MPKIIDKTLIETWYRALQDDICRQLAAEDGEADFITDDWKREEGGGGRTRILQEGKVFDKAGVAFSAVHGPASKGMLKSLEIPEDKWSENMEFYATGVSLVIHPKSPKVPIIHMNTRYFELTGGIWWFGGGIDLTPIYVNQDDARFFHRQLKNVCDEAHADFYPKFKKWADDYFFVKHRNETRGIGGIFYDRLNESDPSGLSKEALFKFNKEVGEAFCPTYRTLVQKNRFLPAKEKEYDWQRLRRGRYVEYNLVLDRGTKFGLESGGRTESILMSLPPRAEWAYNFIPKPGTPEAETISFLKKGIDWV